MPQNNFPRIVSLGVLNLDFVMELSNEMIGKKKMGRQISINAGGHGSSQAIAAVRCGVPTALIGKVGDDAFGQQIQSTLELEHFYPKPRASTAALQPSSLRISRITLLLIFWEPTTS